ncbi:MAG: hypothetical protein QOJ38_1837 [Solirubrobacterales bacterium]|jgi:hypothetical protein|nr:hypothetical protein [Solirubrobacterales bacterium]
MNGRGQAHARARRRQRRLILAALSAAIVFVLSAIARADDPTLPVDPGPDPSGQGALIDQASTDPGLACQDQVDKNNLGSTTQGAGCDNPYTPIGQDGKGIGWTQIAGAVHPDANKPSGYDFTVQNARAPIPPTVDFYTVRFANSKNGFAGGAQCQKDAPQRQDGESNSAYQDRITPFLNTCERVPVIYRYTEDSELGPIWQEAYKGTTPGFVGAISWLHNTNTKDHGQRALAVGGTGSPNANCPKSETDPSYPKEDNPTCGGYPRREPAIPDSACPLNPDEIKAADANPDGKKPEVKFLPGVIFPQVDSSQSVLTLRDVQEAQARCEDQWRQAHDAAGKGRAWLFSDGDWQDLGTPGEGLPSGMRGMTALDASLDTEQCAGATGECAMAGALQQIWMWKDGDFDPKPWQPDPPPGTPASKKVSPSQCVLADGAVTSGTSAANYRRTGCKWHYRIRAIRFVQAYGGTFAIAATSGCCTSSPDLTDHGRWAGRTTATPKAGLMMDYDARNGTWTPGFQPGGLPDSYFAMAAAPTTGIRTTLAAPGGPQRDGEPPSQIIQSAGDSESVTGLWVSTARLVAGDGSSQGNQLALEERLSGDSGDSLMDWAVGGFKGGQRGSAYTTTMEPSPGRHGVKLFPLECPAGFLDGNAQSTGSTAASSAPKCTPKEQARMADETRSGYLFKLSSYFLNGFNFAGDSGIGWGVGDRGAIERLAGNDVSSGGTLKPESAPQLGPKRVGSASPTEPYRSTAPKLSDAPGVVPGRVSQELQKLSEPRMTSYGSPNPYGLRDGRAEGVGEVIMSRDGSEGWALGPKNPDGGNQTTLVHFDGSRWRPCGTDSVEGVIKADPACAELRSLMHYRTATDGNVMLTAAARIPMEYGSDPTQADDFEVIAIGSPDATKRQPVLRYHDGRWAVDEDWTNQLNPASANSTVENPGPVTDIAFSGPDDGWIVADEGSYSIHHMYHFDGERWTRCGSNLGQDSGVDAGGVVEPIECRDHDHLLPTNPGDGGMHLTSAGDRLYFYANRTDTNRQSASGNQTAASSANRYPLILYKDPGPCEKGGDAGCWQKSYDPGCVRQEPDPADPTKINCIANEDPVTRGNIYSLSVARGPDGSYNGWGLGQFGANGSLAGAANTGIQGGLSKGAAETPLIKSDAEGTTGWAPILGDDAANQALLAEKAYEGSTMNPIRPPAEIVALPGTGGDGMVVATFGGIRPAVWLNPTDQRWRMVPTPWCTNLPFNCPRTGGELTTMAADNTGGVWTVALAPYGTAAGQEEARFYRFSDRVQREVFTEVPHPIREVIIAHGPNHSQGQRIAGAGAAGGGDGSFWVATEGNVVYRYDRQTGWDRITIPGWDPGRFATNPSPAYAIAIGASGSGVVVGKHGRIANVGPGGARLDPAAGVLCSPPGKPRTPPPCGTGRDLKAASVAPDGSAMVGGDSRALLYRKGSAGAFDAINPPPAALYANITGVSLPRSNAAWVTTDLGEIYGGTFDGSDWSWKREDADEFGDSLSRDTSRHNRPLWAIAIDASGHGYAVGENGTIIERTGEGSPPWRRIDAGVFDELHAVTLGPGGEGALISGDNGLILTETRPGNFEFARFTDRYDPVNRGTREWVSRLSGVALLAGPKDGQVEAWAVSQTPSVFRSPVPAVLHYTNDPSDAQLDGVARGAESLGDSPSSSPDRLSFAAFGNSDCQYERSPNGGEGIQCPELTGNKEANQLVARQIRDELLARQGRPNGIDFNLFTGDVGSVGGSHRNRLLGTPLTQSAIHDRWRELIVDPLAEAGLPLFGAIGPRDLGTTAWTCQPYGAQGNCFSADETQSGVSTGWRQSMAGMPAPWGALGSPAARSSAGLSFEPVDTGGTKKELDDTPIEDPTKETLGGKTIEDPTKAAGGTKVPDPRVPGSNLHEVPQGGYVGDTKIPESGAVGDQKLPTGGAHTHYALDVKRDGKALMRLVVLDTSLKSLAASNHNQNPVEEQLGWLKDALQRPADERAVVLTSTPTYSYGPGATTDTLAEGTALESILMQNKVDLVVDGRLGWNALYYALQPGLHWPCPGDGYPTGAHPTLPSCGPAGSSDADKAAGEAQSEAQKQAAELTGGSIAEGGLPFLIAHSAGGKFGPDGQSQGSAANGFWRGYSVVHLDAKTGQIQIEQRPVYDWIGVGPAQGQAGKGHVLRPKQSITLSGYGREVLGIDTGPQYDEITTSAITHCYDLVLADQEKPWLPLKADDASKEQLAAASGAGCRSRFLDSGFASTQNDSGAANPCDPYVCLDPAIGRLTDDQQGKIEAGDGNFKRTFAIAILSVNQKVATYPISFEPRPSFTPEAPPPPPPPSNPPPPPAPPPPPGSQLPQINLPQPPVPPSVPLDAGLVPPPPPAVPPPPGSSTVTPLNLFLNGPGLNIAPQSTVVPPPAPPIQPAPPGGARKEARQKQAATQDSGAGTDESSSEAQHMGGDMAQSDHGPEGSAMTRHENSATRLDRVAPGQSFTPLAHHRQPSAWVQGLEWGGGMTLMALVLAFGWITVRPTPRRREPELPAPAYARYRDRGRR